MTDTPVAGRADYLDYRIGDRVKKHTGDYQLEGEVRAVFTTRAGKTRLVVEHNPGFLHIYGPQNLVLLAPAPAAPAPAADTVREAVIAALTDVLGDALDCTRVWEAWSVGTMSADDFVLLTERFEEIADAVIAALATLPRPADSSSPATDNAACVSQTTVHDTQAPRPADGPAADAGMREAAGWQRVPNVGDEVRADHPITVLNPTQTFIVYERRFKDDRVSVRGENTCWFDLGMISPAAPPPPEAGVAGAGKLPPPRCWVVETAHGAILGVVETEEEARGHLRSRPIAIRPVWGKESLTSLQREKAAAMGFLDGSRAVIARLEAERDALAAEVERLRECVEQAETLSAEQVEWVTNDAAELGVKVRDQFFFLYKGRSLVYGALDPDPTVPPVHDDGTPMHWRPVFKREFGECAHPINYEDPKLIGKVSLDDSEDWKPLPAARAAKGGA
ncbi:hypothetical protein GCM10011390_42110 [Aureimonas endophytica]|uniref:Uncharacterized protein n=1 Tax=Aureimonas endophytica TaxID=2027858 RepID=A0A917EA79_9HYPH|nr:hypothetical protein [Aureimonas endophytica]GGE18512.1 hypothetical protein GCM10011390_42110 [Aureimonas endophytica]